MVRLWVGLSPDVCVSFVRSNCDDRTQYTSEADVDLNLLTLLVVEVVHLAMHRYA